MRRNVLPNFTELNGMHLFMCLWIIVSSSTSFAPKTLSLVSLASSKYNASFRCFLQSRIRIFRRTGLSFDPAGKMTAVWSVFIDIEKGTHFPNKSGRFVRTISNYAAPLVGKSTREFHPDKVHLHPVGYYHRPKQWSIQRVDLKHCPVNEQGSVESPKACMLAREGE